MANTILEKTVNELIKRLEREIYGPYIIQNNGTVVPAGDLVTDEYTIYPKSVGSYFDHSGRFYMRPDTVYGPKLLRPLIHLVREHQHPKNVNLWDLIKSAINPLKYPINIPKYSKDNSSLKQGGILNYSTCNKPTLIPKLK